MIDKRRYALARERSNNMLDRDDTIDKFLTDRFIEIILEQKKVFHNALIIGDKNNFTENKLNSISIKNVAHVDILKKDTSINFYLLNDDEKISDIGTYDLIISLSLINFLDDIPSFSKQAKNLLSKDGLILLNFFSENSLLELKEMFSSVESELYNGISQRFMPVVDIRDIGDLMNNLGFSDTVVSRENLKYFYPNFKDMLGHLRLMSCTNFLKVKQNKYINKIFMNKLITYFDKRKINNFFELNIEVLIINSWKK